MAETQAKAKNRTDDVPVSCCYDMHQKRQLLPL